MAQSPGRLARRDAIARERESRALDLMVAGASNATIAADLGVTAQYVTGLLRRGLERRAREEGPTVEAARQVYIMRLERLVAAFMPLATGTYAPDGVAAPPDVRSGELLLKVLTQLAAVQGRSLHEAVQAAARVDVYHHTGDDRDIRETILADLAEVASHGRVVEGHLAGQNATLDGLVGPLELDDKPAPPPDWQPPEPPLEG